MKLTRLFTLSTAVLAVLVCGMLGRIVWDQWSLYRNADTGLRTLHLVRRAMMVAEKVSLERGPTNSILGLQYGQPDHALRAQLAEARGATDQALSALDTALQASDQRYASAVPPPPDESAALRHALAQARLAIDDVAALPHAARTTERLRDALERMFQLVPLALNAVTAAMRASEQAYPHISRILMKARLAVELREYAGRVGSLLTVALTTRQPLAAAELRELQVLHGRIEELRELIKLPDSEAGSGPQVMAAVAHMDWVYFSDGRQLIAEIELASRTGRDYGMDAARFTQRYVPSMTPILALRDVLLDRAQAHAKTDYDYARRALIQACVVGLAILLALTLLLLIVRGRVVVPMLRATAAAIRLGQGDYSRDPRAPRHADEISDMLRALSTLRANSMERERLEQERLHLMEELRLRADTDYLTGILNRRAFAAAGNVRLRGARERNESLAVVLFDIDHFKSVNDSHGHDAGDQVLIQVAGVVRAELRDGEILARYGGEEFVVMPAYCGLEAASALAERLRGAIADTPITLADQHVLRVTASFGVAAAAGPHAALDDLFHVADLALYRAKRNGRNRVERQA